jgi:hypothetical protein
MKFRILSGWILTLCIATAGAAVEPTSVRVALPKKTESYLKEGMISGGDREVQFGIVKDIRRATNDGFERIVIDIDSEKAPYYQAAIDPERKRILVTLFGSPRLAFNAKKIMEGFRKSPRVEKVELFPLLEEESWTFAIYLKAAMPVEVFELYAPTRIVFDLKSSGMNASDAGKKDRRTAPVKALKKVTSPTHVSKVEAHPEAPKAIQSNPNEDEFEGNGSALHFDEIPE